MSEGPSFVDEQFGMLAASSESEHRRSDLCDSCRSASVCVFASPDRDPVLHCPNYRGIEGNSSGARVAEVSEGPLNTGSAGPGGLCARCSIAETCTKDRPPGGVWQCEDFS
jgi:hypothetical protein